jgi:hypothetical protein
MDARGVLEDSSFPHDSYAIWLSNDFVRRILGRNKLIKAPLQVQVSRVRDVMEHDCTAWLHQRPHVNKVSHSAIKRVVAVYEH